MAVVAFHGQLTPLPVREYGLTANAHDCLRGQNADADCLRGHGQKFASVVGMGNHSFMTVAMSRVCGHGSDTISRSQCRRICHRVHRFGLKGHENLPPGRSKACPVLNIMRNTLPPLLAQLVAPLLQLCGDGFNAGGLFNRSHFNVPGVVVGREAVSRTIRSPC